MKTKEKKYWHELSGEEKAEAIEKEMTWDEFNQPDWCGYLEALNGLMGCWSLTGDANISKEFCKNCDQFIKE